MGGWAVVAFDADDRAATPALQARAIGKAIQRRGDAASAVRRPHQALVGPGHQPIELHPHTVEMRQRRESDPAIPGKGFRVEGSHAEVAARVRGRDALPPEIQRGVAAQLQRIPLPEQAKLNPFGKLTHSFRLQRAREQAENPQPRMSRKAARHPRVQRRAGQDQFAACILVTVKAPPTLSASNLILSPTFTWSSIAGSLTWNTMVIGGMSRFCSGPCLMVIFFASLSTLRTSPSLSAAPGCAAPGAPLWCASSA